MSKYKVGDEVLITGTPLNEGERGTIIAMDRQAAQVDVLNSDPLWFKYHHLVPVACPAQPTADVVAHPVQYPADGHPEHYTAGLPTGVAAVDVIKAHLEAGGTWDTANALKYILRHHAKENPTQDIKKAIRCLNMWVAEQEAA